VDVAAGTGTADEPVAGDRAFELSVPTPNPASATFRFSVAIPTAQDVRIEIIDALGRRVAILHDGSLAGGLSHSFSFDVSALPGGAYLLRAAGSETVATQRVTVTR
jgi:hypothetical protein